MVRHDFANKFQPQGLDALAVDLDGTLTSGGLPLKRRPAKALRALKSSGTKIILATGRCVSEANRLVGEDLFDAIVAEEGALLAIGGAKKNSAPAGWNEVRAHLSKHFKPGCEEVILSAGIDTLSAALNLIPSQAKIELNKDRLMIVPRGVDKGTGLADALSRLHLKGARTACIGDGENDAPMFDVAGVRVALKNSVPALKRRADFVTSGSDGEGTVQAIEKLFPWTKNHPPGRSVPEP
ncbi:MAG: HAD hydrolase family protein [Thaumarchaeota archaeon]|nr:HAD hydrolase family protein [Nitrososphaerota archaeon]